jgi:glycosyltransferase involved in cell wall biosynthesis
MKTDIILITPLHPCLNPRLVKEADALAEAGYRVGVIAPVFSSWACDADKAYADRAWTIVERPQYGPHAPAMSRFVEIARRTAAMTWVHLFGVNCAAAVRAAIHPASPLLVAAAQRHRADLYIAHVMPALPAVALAARAHGARYAYDAEDFHLGEPPSGPGSDHRRELICAVEAPYLKECAYVTASSPDIADAYASAYHIATPVTVLNVFPTYQAPSGPTAAGTAAPGPSIYWYSQTIGLDRGLSSAIRAIGQSTTKPYLYLRGNVCKATSAALMSVARDAGVEDRVHFLAPALPEKLVGLASRYDIGLCSEPGGTENNKRALANKLLVYLLAGLPALISDTPAHLRFATGAGGATEVFTADEPDSLAKAIDHVLGSPTRLARMRAEAWRLGQTKYNWDIEKAKFLEQVDRAIGPPMTLHQRGARACGHPGPGRVDLGEA